MRKVFLTIILGIGIGVNTTLAQEVKTTHETVTTPQIPEDIYFKIELTELPAAISNAVATHHEGKNIKEAYVCKKNEGQFFKLILTDNKGTETIAVYNEKGEPIKE